MALLDPTPAKTHGLLCPACKVDLVMADRQGIEIDYCPKCRGVWLDRGELDKIVERSNERPDSRSSRERSRDDDDRYDDHRDSDRRSHGYDEGRPRKRKSWLNELFD